MENKLEQLLNMLIQKGWKPFWDNAIKFDYDWMKTRYWYWAITYRYRDCYIDDYWDEVEYEEWRRQFNNRELVSKESGLWQFVCENGMAVKKRQWTNRQWWEPENCFNYEDYRYRLIESALKDESELESFILDSIKV